MHEPHWGYSLGVNITGLDASVSCNYFCMGEVISHLNKCFHMLLGTDYLMGNSCKVYRGLCDDYNTSHFILMNAIEKNSYMNILVYYTSPCSIHLILCFDWLLVGLQSDYIPTGHLVHRLYPYGPLSTVSDIFESFQCHDREENTWPSVCSPMHNQLS